MGTTVVMFKMACPVYDGCRTVDSNEKTVYIFTVKSSIWNSIGDNKSGLNVLSQTEFHMVDLTVIENSFGKCRPNKALTTPKAEKALTKYGDARTLEGDKTIFLPTVGAENKRPFTRSL